MARVRIAVVGCGYWGPNLVRTFAELPETALVAVVDRDPSRLAQIRNRHAHIKHFLTDPSELFHMDLDAVVIATPAETHFDMVKRYLEHDLDVFVEKPLATTSAEAEQLVEIAEARGRVLMVGHIGAYTPSVCALKEMLDDNELGDIAYVDAIRGGLGLFHSSLNVIWDLAPHDISILMYLLDQVPVTVCAHGSACIESSIEDIAYLTLMFPNGVLGHTRLSWLDPCKTRRITVVGRRKMVVYDDLEAHEKLKVYDKRVDAIRQTDTFGEYQFAYHYGSVVSPYVRHDEPLRLECAHFAECVTTRQAPRTDGVNGLHVVKVIQAAQRSLRAGGREVPVDDALTGVVVMPRRDDNAPDDVPTAPSPASASATALKV